jgi:hypothetical protein
MTARALYIQRNYKGTGKKNGHIALITSGQFHNAFIAIYMASEAS